MPSKEMIGRVLSTGSATVSAEHVIAFARALGDPNPLYVDPEAARRGPCGTIVAPPTYPIAFMAQALAGGADVFLELGLDFMTRSEERRVGKSVDLGGRRMTKKKK